MPDRFPSLPRLAPRGPKLTPTKMLPLDVELRLPPSERGAVDDVRTKIADAVRAHGGQITDMVLSALALPPFVRRLVRPYAERAAMRAVIAVAQWIDPTAPDPS